MLLSDFGEVRVSRSDIARMAGVKRPAVTNWERRHADFPASVGGEGEDLDTFRADEVLAWLSGRAIPANALRPGEATGTTYGDRFGAALGGRASGGLLPAVEQLAWRDADRLRGQWRMSDYLRLLLFLVHTRTRDSKNWSRFVDDPESAGRVMDMPEVSGPSPLPYVVGFLDDNPARSPAEERQAFDRLLARQRDTDAREPDEYFTPTSVSRVMARVLVTGPAPVARRLHDPFCRTGELLGAYLDAAAERGGEAPQEITGLTLGEGLMLTMWNLGMRGRERNLLVSYGAREPSDPARYGPPGHYDAVITNPPFGGSPPSRDRRPWYWRFGVARSREYDWLQYAVSSLTHEGRAAVLMPAGAAFRGAERETRTRMVEEGVVECVMALPTQLFELTSIQTHIWFLRAPRFSPQKVIFVDGTDLGAMATRTRRELSDIDTDRLVRAYTSGREAGHRGVPGLSRVVGPEEIADRDHRLDPALYVRERLPGPGGADARAAARHRLAELTGELEGLHARARAADAAAAEQLRRYGL
jgi:type I restriction enzyme M protein